MNILLVSDPFVSLRLPHSTNNAAFVAGLADRLVRQGHSVDVIALDTDERSLFNVIRFDESVFAMKDTAYRPCPEWQGQRHYQSLQFGLLNTEAYDIIHYVTDTPELLEMGALHATPGVVSLCGEPSAARSALYGLFVRRTSAVPVVNSGQLQQVWQRSLAPFTSADIQVVADADVASYARIYEQTIAAAKVEQA